MPTNIARDEIVDLHLSRMIVDDFEELVRRKLALFANEILLKQARGGDARNLMSLPRHQVCSCSVLRKEAQHDGNDRGASSSTYEVFYKSHVRLARMTSFILVRPERISGSV